MTEKQSLRQAALAYHAYPKPGKLEVRATKPLANGRDLSRAYSPGVAEACLEIGADADRSMSMAQALSKALGGETLSAKEQRAYTWLRGAYLTTTSGEDKWYLMQK